MARPLTYQFEGNTNINYGFGINFTGVTYISKTNSFSYQIAGGKGVSFMYGDLGGNGYDGYFDSNGNIIPISTMGGFISYNHTWSPKWTSAFVYSYLTLVDGPNTAEMPYNSSQYASTNLSFYPTNTIKFSAEFLYGSNEQVQNEESKSAYATRLQMSALIKF